MPSDIAVRHIQQQLDAIPCKPSHGAASDCSQLIKCGLEFLHLEHLVLVASPLDYQLRTSSPPHFTILRARPSILQCEVQPELLLSGVNEALDDLGPEWVLVLTGCLRRALVGLSLALALALRRMLLQPSQVLRLDDDLDT